jgi:hypothetical protein
LAARGAARASGGDRAADDMTARTAWGCRPAGVLRGRAMVAAGTEREMMERAREPTKTPGDHKHDPMEGPDAMTRFCAKCGRILAYRAVRNVPWISTEAENRGCDWGG